MMRNRAVKHLLTVKKENLALQDLASYLQEMRAHSGPADEAISAQQLQEAIDREVANLPERMRAVFLLRRDEQLSHQEIADRLGISVLTSRTQLKKAVKYLWSKLSTLFALALAWYLWL
ncbi:RNA polymerase sigma-70 factor, ECF subfamily [bacterium A37T11]|nr:RNA polymerase sigma-70 factor, ECF subfamily [bacterium A37T11]